MNVLSKRLDRLEAKFATKMRPVVSVICLVGAGQSDDQITEYLQSLGIDSTCGEFHIIIQNIVEPSPNGPVYCDVPLRLAPVGKSAEPWLTEALRRQEQLYGPEDRIVH